MKIKTKIVVISILLSAALSFGVLSLTGYYMSKKAHWEEMEEIAKSVHSNYKLRTKILNKAYQIDSSDYNPKIFPVEVWTDTIAKLFGKIDYKAKQSPTYSQAIFRGLKFDSIPDFSEAIIFQVLNRLFPESDSTYFYGSLKSFTKWEFGKKGILQSRIFGDSIQTIYWRRIKN